MTIVSFGAAMENLKGWQKMLKALPEEPSAGVEEYLPVVLLCIYLLCSIVAGAYCLKLVIRTLLDSPSLFTSIRLWIKRKFGMAEWLTEEEAEVVIRQSDFYYVRIYGKNVPNNSPNPWSDRLKQMGISSGQKSKGTIIEKRFVKKILNTFAQRHPKGAMEGQYNAQKLETWLDELIDHEVEDELGQIPSSQPKL